MIPTASVHHSLGLPAPAPPGEYRRIEPRTRPQVRFSKHRRNHFETGRMGTMDVLNLFLFVTIGSQPLLTLMRIDLAALPFTTTGHTCSFSIQY